MLDKKVESKYTCGKHEFFFPFFDRIIDGHSCPRVMCEKCEEESYGPVEKRPKNIPYFYDGEQKAILQEAHMGPAIWRFDPPVVYPEWHFAEDLSPRIPEGAKTSEEIMAQMEELLPEVEKACRENGVNVPDPRDLLILPGRKLRVGSES